MVKVLLNDELLEVARELVLLLERFLKYGGLLHINISKRNANSFKNQPVIAAVECFSHSFGVLPHVLIQLYLILDAWLLFNKLTNEILTRRCLCEEICTLPIDARLV